MNKNLFLSVINIIFLLGFVYSFFNRDQFLDRPDIQGLSLLFYKVVYALLVFFIIVCFSQLLKIKLPPQFLLLCRILFFIFLSWPYGVAIGFINGNPPSHILSNYLFLFLSLLPLLAFSNPFRDVPKLISTTFSITFYASFLYIFYSIKELPGFLSVVFDIFTLDFNRSVYGYSYVTNSPFFVFAAFISLLFIFHRSAFEAFISPSINQLRLSSKFLYFPWHFVSRYPLITFPWFLWLGIFTYTSNAYLLWILVVFMLYLSTIYKFLLPLFMAALGYITYLVIPFVNERFADVRFEQVNQLLALIHLGGNGLGSYTVGRGTPYGTELLSLGLFAQLGIFAIPFFIFLLYYLYNSLVLVLRGRSALFLLTASFSPYVFSIFSNPTIGSPWAFLLVIVGSYVSRIAVLHG